MPVADTCSVVPSYHTHTARAARQTLELREALLHLHAEVSTADSADARVFLEPVDEAFAPCYFEVVKIPMDLSTIGRKIAEDEYPTAWEYMEDFQTMIDNCLAYNKAGTFHNRSRASPACTLLWCMPARWHALASIAHGWSCSFSGCCRVLCA